MEHLAVIQAEMLESAWLVEVGNMLRRQADTCRSFRSAGGLPNAAWRPAAAGKDRAEE